MEIWSNSEGLKTLLGIPSTSPVQVQQARGGSSSGQTQLAGDSATLSGPGTEVSISAGEDGVRMDKVAAVKSALAAGNYEVPASAVASKLVEVMLAGASS